MNATLFDAVARALARRNGRAIPVRHTSAISADPAVTFGIAPIKMVAEEHVQAVAFGRIDAEPQVAVRWNPLSRDPGDLEVFAVALDHFITSALSDGRLPRIWVPHAAALEVLDLLGHRMHRNQRATPELRRMGSLCRAIAMESEFPGQQIVAVAGDLLRTHVVTGQTPTEDGHVAAVVAWVLPPPRVNPVEEAARRSIVPANAMLQRSIDDEIERLRKIGKGKGQIAAAARQRIEHLLREEAIREWNLLIEARNAFLSLGLSEPSNLEKLVTESIERFEWWVTNGPIMPTKPASLRRRLKEVEAAAQRVEDIDARSDARARERLRQQGRVVAAMIEGVVQPNPRRRPESLILRTQQEVLRIRKGTVLQTEDVAVKGRVSHIEYDVQSGIRRLKLELEKGRQKSTHYGVGRVEDWYATDVYDNKFRRLQISKVIKNAQAPLIFGSPIQRPKRSGTRSRALIDAAAGLRR